MENKTELIERLRKIANELEQDLKSEFGKWYITNLDSLYFITSGTLDRGFGYGISNGKWFCDSNPRTVSQIKRIATEFEVLEALTKEVVKRGLVEGNKVVYPWFNEIPQQPTYCGKTKVVNGNFYYKGMLAMQNGIWATIIKERSLENWYKSFINSPLGAAEYMKSTKTELIEILKTLPND